MGNAAVKSKNVVLIHCHDLGDYLSCYDDRHVSTPNIDRLASEATVFEACFAATPTCTPSRASMFTGLYPHSHGLMGLASGGHWQLNPEIPTIASLLADAGYACGHHGIFHIGEELASYGFEEGSLEAKCEPCADNTIEFISRRAHEDAPFFVSVGFQQPHLPWGAVDPAVAEAEIDVPSFIPRTDETRTEMAQFYSDVRRVDTCVGRIIEALIRYGIYDETIVIFTADHGIALPLAKGTLYDAGLKIPLIVRMPDRGGAGRRPTELVSNVDLLPTILDLVGLESLTPEKLDGVSLASLISGADASGPVREREFVFAEQSWHDFYEPIRATRDSRFKLIHNFRPGTGVQIAGDVLQTRAVGAMRGELVDRVRPEYELYDLVKDPREIHNVYDDQQYRETAKRLTARLAQYLEGSGDPITRGDVVCPPGYFEHFFMKSNATPGGIPAENAGDGLFTLRLPPPGALGHRCTQYRA
ncbi:MAG: DUF4976 domain-containing protein [Spirochaetaceae bacterium]|nr:MAG: DUF4976 domain-containing protein [Spirochaetaceae bacterium]